MGAQQLTFRLPLIGEEGSLTKYQLRYLENLGLEGCQRFSHEQASMVISAMEYARGTYSMVKPREAHMPKWERQKVAEYIINNEDLRVYVVERNRRLLKAGLANEDNPIERDDHFRKIAYFILNDLPALKPSSLGALFKGARKAIFKFGTLVWVWAIVFIALVMIFSK